MTKKSQAETAPGDVHRALMLIVLLCKNSVMGVSIEVMYSEAGATVGLLAVSIYKVLGKASTVEKRRIGHDQCQGKKKV